MIKLLIPLLILTSCSSHLKESKPLKDKNYTKQCYIKQNSLEAKHAALSISRDSALVNCFKNYLRFQKNKKQSVSVCHSINIEKSGKPSYVKVKGLEYKLSNDFKICLEQALWVKNLKGLQLSEKIYINFPINYSSKDS